MQTSPELLTRWSATDKMVLDSFIEDDKHVFNATKFQEAIQIVCAMIGCNEPSKEAFIVLYTCHRDMFITDNINNVRKEQIITAFKLYCKGELYFEKAKPEHYNNYNFKFHSEVISAYYVYLNRVIVEARKLTKPDEVVNPKAEDSGWIIRAIIADFTEPEPIAITMKYDELDKAKILNLTKEEKEAMIERGKSSLKAQYTRNNDLQKLRDLNAGHMRDAIIVEAKCIAYLNFLKDKSNLEKVKPLNN